MASPDIPFWQRKSLAQMTAQEWESVCDGCAKCCLHKLEDEDSGEVFYTKIRCRYLQEDSCRCSDYEHRSVLVPNCVHLDQHNVENFDWLPRTCAYRLLAHGEQLPQWHHLVCGDKEAVHRAGVSIRGRAISDEFVHPDGYDEHVIHWIE